MSIDSRLLEILVCPVSKVPVRALTRDKLQVLNREISKGHIEHRDGSIVAVDLQEALVTTDGKTVYPIDDGIPVMLEERGIAANQVPGW